MNIVPVRLEATDGELIAVAGDDGEGSSTLVRLALPQRLHQVKAWLGKTALLGIRPECITLGGHGPTRISAQVEMIEPTGAETMAVLTFAGADIVARMSAMSRPPVGTAAEFSVDLTKSCLFDAATGQRFA